MTSARERLQREHLRACLDLNRARRRAAYVACYRYSSEEEISWTKKVRDRINQKKLEIEGMLARSARCGRSRPC